MPFMENGDLLKYLRDDNILSEATLLIFALEVAEGQFVIIFKIIYIQLFEAIFQEQLLFLYAEVSVQIEDGLGLYFAI